MKNCIPKYQQNVGLVEKFRIANSGVATFTNDITGKGAFNGYVTTTQNLLIDWSSESQVTTLTATNLFFGTNAQRRMTILSGGNIGIGTSSGAATLRPLNILGSQLFPI